MAIIYNRRQILIENYLELKKLIPPIINIRDGSLFENDQNAGYFPSLNSMYELIDKEIEESEIKTQLLWLIFQDLHQMAVKNLLFGKNIIYSTELKMEQVLNHFDWDSL